jgi:hypothetical protein
MMNDNYRPFFFICTLVVVIPYDSIALFFANLNQLAKRRMSYTYCRQIPRRYAISDTR